MTIPFKPGDKVRLRGQKQIKTVRGENQDKPSEVICDWDDNKGNPKQQSYPPIMLEPVEDDEDLLPITMF